jgi:hypothetical protein
MNKASFDQYLREYIREALIFGDKNVETAANYLMNQRTRKYFTKQEKKQALQRAQKIFLAYSDRPLWFVLKCLGTTLEELGIA